MQQPQRSRNTRLGSSNTNETHLLTIDQTLDPEVPIPEATHEVENVEQKPVTITGQIIETDHEHMSGTNQPQSEQNATIVEIDDGPMIQQQNKGAQVVKQRTDDLLLGTGTQIRSNQLEFVIGEEEVFKTLTAGGTRQGALLQKDILRQTQPIKKIDYFRMLPSTPAKHDYLEVGRSEGTSQTDLQSMVAALEFEEQL